MPILVELQMRLNEEEEELLMLNIQPTADYALTGEVQCHFIDCHTTLQFGHHHHIYNMLVVLVNQTLLADHEKSSTSPPIGSALHTSLHGTLHGAGPFNHVLDGIMQSEVSSGA